MGTAEEQKQIILSETEVGYIIAKLARYMFIKDMRDLYRLLTARLKEIDDN